MIGLLESFARPFLHALDPETAHRATILALRSAILPPPRADDPCLAVEAFGLRFPNPVGIAAGFDKHAEAVDSLFALGFGFVEIGTVTPRPQPGNSRPRLFRLTRDRAVINRFGFNSEGHDAVAARLRVRAKRPGIVGVNVGANKDSEDKAADYVAGVEAFADVASYFTINVSSPNTPGLRDLQQAKALDDLLARVVAKRDQMTEHLPRRPLLLKIAPDLALDGLDDVVRIALARKIDGMIVSNTTIARPSSLGDSQRNETGGLSGHPLFDLSTRMLAETAKRVEGKFPLVGVGGIDSADDRPRKTRGRRDARAALFQSLVFEGDRSCRPDQGRACAALDIFRHREQCEAIQAIAGLSGWLRSARNDVSVVPVIHQPQYSSQHGTTSTAPASTYSATRAHRIPAEVREPSRSSRRTAQKISNGPNVEPHQKRADEQRDEQEPHEHDERRPAQQRGSRDRRVAHIGRCGARDWPPGRWFRSSGGWRYQGCDVVHRWLSGFA